MERIVIQEVEQKMTRERGTYTENPVLKNKTTQCLIRNQELVNHMYNKEFSAQEKLFLKDILTKK